MMGLLVMPLCFLTENDHAGTHALYLDCVVRAYCGRHGLRVRQLNAVAIPAGYWSDVRQCPECQRAATA